ncbi:MAG: glycosyltransferase family 4 protein, partial [Spirochaetales bacterium]|nr:glycosyltransferase family 4 protein [Spirochaetales bacterium]
YSFWQKLFEKYVVRHERTVQHVFISGRLKKDYIDKYRFLENKNCIVLPVGAEPVNTLERVGNYNKVLSCGYIGSFKKGKGAELVFSLAGQLPHIPFHIVGGSDDEISSMKREYPAENIVWHGALAYKDAMKILSDKIDIALLPNQKEVFLFNNDPKSDIGRWTSPMKLLEYLAYEKAIVASDLPILKEILVDNENCLLADPDDQGAWCSAIGRLAGDSDLCQRLGKNGRSLIEEELSWERRAEKSLEFYH